MSENLTAEAPTAEAPTTATAGSAGEALRRFFATGWWWFCMLLGSIVCLQVVAILLSRLGPTVELAVHFAFHGLVLGIVVLGLLAFFRRTWGTWCIAAAVVYLLYLVQPWSLYWPITSSPPAEAMQSVRVLSWNVLAVNLQFAAIDRVIREVDADVVVLIETQPNMLQYLPSLREMYPLSAEHLQWGGSGICIFSRQPGTTFQLADFNCARQPALIAAIPRNDSGQRDTREGDSGDAEIKLVGLHTMSPLPVARAIVRDKQLMAMLEWSDEEVVPICICGDFNTTPWTKSFQEIVRRGFVDSRVGVGNLPSWPSPLGWLAIPIDHALTKGRCYITDRKVLAEAPGSDHRPIAFTLHY